MTPAPAPRVGMVGIDTNVILRVMLNDDPEQSEIARQVFRDLSPQRLGFVTSVTLAEVYWTLARGRGLSKAACLAAIRLLVEIEVLEFDDGEGAVRALELAEAASLGCDFGLRSSTISYPACDLVLAWTFLDAPARAVFRRTVGADDAMWARARGWALWKVLITLADDPPSFPVVEAVLAD